MQIKFLTTQIIVIALTSKLSFLEHYSVTSDAPVDPWCCFQSSTSRSMFPFPQ